MIRNSIFILFIAISSSSFAQFHTTYDWAEEPSIHEIFEGDQSESSIGILEKYIVEYQATAFSAKVYETKHTITKVLDEKGISRHNTVYIPMYGVKEIIDIKARTITVAGKVTLLNKDNIKEVKNVEEYGDFKIFAIEGAEKNAEIEVLYTVEKEYDMHGSETLQRDYKILKCEFLFITDNLNSRIKAYRTNTQFQDTTIDGKSAKQLVINNLPAMIEEEYATPDANKVTVTYQCFPAGQDVTNEMFWDNIAGNIGSGFFPATVPETINSDLKSLYTEKKDYTLFETVLRLDDFIKTNFTVVQNNNPELSDIEYIIKNRTSSQFGILKTYAYYLTALKVDYEIVLTANRYTYKFDPEFYNPSMLRDFLIYVPVEQKYLAPDRPEYRFGEAPFNILGNNAVFINKNLEYYFGEVEQADPLFSRIKRKTDITFEEDMLHAKISMIQEYYGHWSVTNRAIMAWSTDQNIKDFEDYLTSSGIEDKVVEDFSIENGEIMQLEYNKPFRTISTITSESILEEAGDSYIFQIGKVIGTQSELYQETARLNPIEMQYPNQYDYTITVHIPDGYEVEGLESLNIDKRYLSGDGDVLAKFESGYSLEGNKLIITIQEVYKSVTYDLDRYEEFRTVINAASDFNKAAILLKVAE